MEIASHIPKDFDKLTLSAQNVIGSVVQDQMHVVHLVIMPGLVGVTCAAL